MQFYENDLVGDGSVRPDSGLPPRFTLVETSDSGKESGAAWGVGIMQAAGEDAELGGRLRKRVADLQYGRMVGRNPCFAICRLQHGPSHLQI